MWLWNRRGTPAPARAPSPAPLMGVHRIRAWTEADYVTGTILSADPLDRLSDIINRREPIPIVDAFVVPVGSAFTAGTAMPLLSIDPLEVRLALGHKLSMADIAGRAARRVHKVRYPVLVLAGAFELRGTLHMYPGNAPEFATRHRGAVFLPLSEPVVRRDGRLVSGPETDVALISRHEIRQIRQLDTVH